MVTRTEKYWTQLQYYVVKIFERLIGQSIYGNVEMLCEVVSFITVSVIQFTAGSAYRGVCLQGGLHPVGLPTGVCMQWGLSRPPVCLMGVGQIPTLRKADSTHPTGMLSCNSYSTVWRKRVTGQELISTSTSPISLKVSKNIWKETKWIWNFTCKCIFTSKQILLLKQKCCNYNNYN